MKKILFMAIVAILSSACSNDDSPTNLLRIEQKHFTNGAISSRTTYHYQEGFLTRTNYYDHNRILQNVMEYNYSNGMLYYQEYNTDDLSRQYILTYYPDGSKKLSGLKYEETYIEDSYFITYTHNNDNTITAERTGTNPGVKTFYINEQGLIYKETGAFHTYELTFDGQNPVSAAMNDDITSFEYDHDHDPSLLGIQSGTGEYILNKVLYKGSLAEAGPYSANRYLIKETKGNVVKEYKYTFNGNGLPTKRKDYKNGELVSEQEYIYN